jgi:hypothetical protein
MMWVYIAIALVSAVGAILLRRVLKDSSIKQRVGASVAIVAGLAFFVIYELKIDQDVFILVLGLICMITGVHSLETGRLEERIRQLEDEIRASRGGSDEG